jgi:hypothetical protein
MRVEENARRILEEVLGAGFAGGALIGLSGQALGANEVQARGKLFMTWEHLALREMARRLTVPRSTGRSMQAASAGGGTVYFRAGNYLSYSIHLKSKVAIYLDAGATIVAADPSSLIRVAATIWRSRTQPLGGLSGLRAQPLAQQPDLGRRAGGRFDLRAGADLGQRLEPWWGAGPGRAAGCGE